MTRITNEHHWACATALSETLRHYRQEGYERFSTYVAMIDALDLIMDKLDLDGDERANLIG